MVQLYIPHLNILSKMDLVDLKEEELEKYLRLDMDGIGKFGGLTERIVGLLDEYPIVQFFPVDLRKKETLEAVLYQVDLATQYGEDLEPKEPEDVEREEF